MSEVGKWHEVALGLFSAEYPDRVISNLACSDVGLSLLDRMCGQLGLPWDDVFPLTRESCREQLSYATQEYLFDGGTHNKTVVEQTMEIMSRMGLTQDVEYAFEMDGAVLCIWLNQAYDALTKYVKDHAVVTELLPYAQFKSQLKHCDFFIANNSTKRIGGNLEMFGR